MTSPPFTPGLHCSSRDRNLFLISCAAALEKVMTRMVEGLAMPESIRRRTLSARTKVLPLPGPAITAQGPCPWQMALC